MAESALERLRARRAANAQKFSDNQSEPAAPKRTRAKKAAGTPADEAAPAAASTTKTPAAGKAKAKPAAKPAKRPAAHPTPPGAPAPKPKKPAGAGKTRGGTMATPATKAAKIAKAVQQKLQEVEDAKERAEIDRIANALAVALEGEASVGSANAAAVNATGVLPAATVEPLYEDDKFLVTHIDVGGVPSAHIVQKNSSNKTTIPLVDWHANRNPAAHLGGKSATNGRRWFDRLKG